MLNVLKMSEAASIAIHAMVMLAANKGRPLTANDIVSVLKVSGAHLSKVMQRLVRAGLAVSARGPGGGFELKGNAGAINLLQIYEAIDGSLILNDCLLERAVCCKNKCIFDKLLKRVNRDFYKYLSKTLLKNVVKKNGGKPWKIS